MSERVKQLAVNAPAPDFTLTDERGVAHTLSAYRSRSHVVLIFYPKDFTPGCTQQLCAVRDDYQGFADRQTVVLGINSGDAAEHQKFVSHHKLKNPLLVDAGRFVAAQYGAVGSFMGHPTTKRTVVIVDRRGSIRYYRHGLPPNVELFQVLDGLNQERNTL